MHINYLYGNWKNYLNVGFNLFDINRALWGLNFFLILLFQPFSLLTAKPLGTSLVAQTVKHLPAMSETRVQFLGWKYPLEKEMAMHSSTLAWKIPWMEGPDRLQSMGLQRVRHN